MENNSLLFSKFKYLTLILFYFVFNFYGLYAQEIVINHKNANYCSNESNKKEAAVKSKQKVSKETLFKKLVSAKKGKSLYTSREDNSMSNVYIDKSVLSFPKVKSIDGVFQLISHGRSGELFIDNKWKDAKEIALFLSSKYSLENIYHINI